MVGHRPTTRCRDARAAGTSPSPIGAVGVGTRTRRDTDRNRAHAGAQKKSPARGQIREETSKSHKQRNAHACLSLRRSNRNPFRRGVSPARCLHRGRTTDSSIRDHRSRRQTSRRSEKTACKNYQDGSWQSLSGRRSRSSFDEPGRQGRRAPGVVAEQNAGPLPTQPKWRPLGKPHRYWNLQESLTRRRPRLS